MDKPIFNVYNENTWKKIPQIHCLSKEQQFVIEVVSKVLPFRVNKYVVDSLINWNNIPDDPMFQLLFPQEGMLRKHHFEMIADALINNATKNDINQLANKIRLELNPHPSGQQEYNVPHLDGNFIEGLQHKYNETVLFFPKQGQTCHSYCTFCFRWAQFVGIKELKFVSENLALYEYLKRNKQITDLLITGGDPLVAKTHHLVDQLEVLLGPEYNHITNIRIGTKSLSFWPYRFTVDDDSGDLLLLFEKLVKSGKHVAIMAHYNHWQELESNVARDAIKCLLNSGVVIRSQAPVLAHINDDSKIWSRLWKTQVNLGVVPYYMFVERDTGACNYFELPLERAWQIYTDAMQEVSGLCKTARGPSMSAAPGKVEVLGITEIAGQKVFVLRFIQARNPQWINKPFFAKYDSRASWLNALKPAFEEKFFYEDEFKFICDEIMKKKQDNKLILV